MRETTLFDERLEETTEIADPAVDVLAEGGLHKIMLFFHQPATWSDGTLLLVWLIATGLSGLLWRLLSGDKNSAWMVLLFSGLIMAADMLLLRSLPRRGISYGPWQAQFVVLALPRLAATAVAAFVGRVLGLEWGIGLFLSAQLLGLAALIWGTEIEPFRLRLTEFIMFTDRMKPGSPPLRLLHITDLHIERLTAREEQVVELAKKAKPDVIVITGDFVNLSYNRDPETHRQVWQLLRRLKAPYGVYATLGSPTVDLRETVVPIFNDLPVQLLRQECVLADVGHGRTITLIGLDCTHHIPTDEARLAQMMAQSPANSPQVLLYHSPELAPQAVQHGIDLYLCGHTHGGQVRLPIIGPLLTSSQLGRRFVMGLYHYGRTHLYVSRGVGLEGLSAPRVRFLCPPEITLVTIRPASL